jgi:transposase InsO family protein
VSERRACKLVGQCRSTQRYSPLPGDFEQRLVKRINEIATEHPRWGYRTVCSRLRAEGWQVNVKRVERLWRLEGHRVPPQRKHHGQKPVGGVGGSTWSLQATVPNEIWSWDFVSTRTEDGQGLRVLNVVDEYTRRCLGIHVARSIGARDLTKVLDGLFRRHGRPGAIRSDNGREFISAELGGWLTARQVSQIFIEKGSPQQNAYVERFNGTMRNEKLNGELFRTVLEAKVVLEEWVDVYNTIRPHTGLGRQTPQAFYEAYKVGSK